MSKSLRDFNLSYNSLNDEAPSNWTYADLQHAWTSETNPAVLLDTLHRRHTHIPYDVETAWAFHIGAGNTDLVASSIRTLYPVPPVRFRNKRPHTWE